jgi:predicted transcriptional regulator
MTFRQLRERAGFKTGVRLAAAAGVKQTTVSQLDYGKVQDPRYSTVEAIAEALGVTEAVVMRAVRQSKRAA